MKIIFLKHKTYGGRVRKPGELVEVSEADAEVKELIADGFAEERKGYADQSLEKKKGEPAETKVEPEPAEEKQSDDEPDTEGEPT